MTMQNDAHEVIRELATRLNTLREAQPGLRARDEAARLGVSEMLLAQADPRQRVLVLGDDMAAILKQVESLGRVMALTRNDSVVHERKGIYKNLSFNAHVGLAVGEDVDLRMFLKHWAFALAVETRRDNGDIQRSLQFFDASGTAVHKIFLLAESNLEAFERLIGEFAHPSRRHCLPTSDSPVMPAHVRDGVADNLVDLEAYRAAWDALKDIHDFHPMTRRFGLGREQALRLAGETRARQLDADIWMRLLREAAEAEVPIMVFAGNGGCIQIHTGPVRQLKQVGDWYNVLDPDFNLHVRMDDIARVWLIRRPGDHGMVTSLEMFNDDGLSLMTFFGKRKPGIPELPEWRELLASLDTAGEVAVPA